jgi:hypothetical protein
MEHMLGVRRCKWVESNFDGGRGSKIVKKKSKFKKKCIKS